MPFPWKIRGLVWISENLSLFSWFPYCRTSDNRYNEGVTGTKATNAKGKTMTTKTEKTVASELKRLDNQRGNRLRELFYQVADALPQLAEELELADLDLGGDGGPLIDQYLTVCKMLEAFDSIKLGKYL